MLPSTLTTIGEGAFYYCSSLSGSLIIPGSVTTIGDYAFMGCTPSSIAIFAETPPVLGDEVFDYYMDPTPPVYVLCGFEETYSSVSWGGFSNFQGLCGGTVAAVANPVEGGNVTGGGSFEAGQTCTVNATANEGYTFMFWTINGVVVSRSSTYTFYVAEDGDLVAHFVQVQEGNIDFADEIVKSICVDY